VRQTLSHFSQNMVIFLIEFFENTKQKITGPLTEISVPIDRLSRKMKGYACVTFMVPENAVKAYSKLDGKVFQGRMLHLLPGKTKKSYSEMAEEGTKSIHFKSIDLFNFLLLESLFNYFFLFQRV
jgi:RNA recognition motif-containing protein